MTDVHKQFTEFHDKIKLSDENEILRGEREELKENLEEKISDDAPAIDRYLLQGSYAIYTGINPPNHDYDIDVGVVFNCTRDDYKPLKLKEMVLDALDHSSRDPVIKNPCVTVHYRKNGDDAYHVDMPVYVKRTDGIGYDLAWGQKCIYRMLEAFRSWMALLSTLMMYQQMSQFVRNIVELLNILSFGKARNSRVSMCPA